MILLISRPFRWPKLKVVCGYITVVWNETIIHWLGLLLLLLLLLRWTETIIHRLLVGNKAVVHGLIWTVTNIGILVWRKTNVGSLIGWTESIVGPRCYLVGNETIIGSRRWIGTKPIIGSLLVERSKTRIGSLVWHKTIGSSTLVGTKPIVHGLIRTKAIIDRLVGSETIIDRRWSLHCHHRRRCLLITLHRGDPFPQT